MRTGANDLASSAAGCAARARFRRASASSISLSANSGSGLKSMGGDAGRERDTLACGLESVGIGDARVAVEGHARDHGVAEALLGHGEQRLAHLARQGAGL